MKFTKMQGCGNDYIYVNCFTETVADPSAAAIRLSDRHFGVGGDGLVLICPSNVADFCMEMYNADGSRSEMCGNAIRCFAKYAYEHGETTKETFTIETLAGVMKPTLTIENGIVTQVTVDMGKPFFKSQDIPMNVDMDKVIDVDLDVNGETVTVSSVLLGVPHTEVFIDDITKAPVTTQGPILEKHDAFPSNTNVNYIEVINDKHIKVRTWERGAGATLACGTGSCASAVMSFEKGLTGREVDVELYLGTLHISYLEDGTVLMTGPAEEVFETELPID